MKEMHVSQYKEIRNVLETLIQDFSEGEASNILQGKSEWKAEVAQIFEKYRVRKGDTKIESATENESSELYANEEVESEYTYPSDYRILSLEKQIQKLKKYFPELQTERTQEYIQNILPTLTLPSGAEGWFACPRWEKIAPSYNEAVEKMLGILGKTRTLYNYRDGELGSDSLKLTSRTQEMWKRLESEQDGDILIIVAQFGLRHRGRSVRRARAIFESNECGLGSFMVGCMLLTHPNRLHDYTDLGIDCAGDEYRQGSSVDFLSAPCFHYYDDGMGFFTYSSVNTYYNYGSASSLLPQSI